MEERHITCFLDKVVVIIGANCKAAIEVARDLYFRSGRLFLADNCTEEKSREIIDEITRHFPRGHLDRSFYGPQREITFIRFEILDFKSVRAFVNELKDNVQEINVIINMKSYIGPLLSSDDGRQRVFQANFLAFFFVVIKMLPRIKGRIITLAASSHYNARVNFTSIHTMHGKYTPLKAYNASHLCNLLFMKLIARKLKEAGNTEVTSYVAHQKFLMSDTKDFFNYYLTSYSHRLINPLKHKLLNYQNEVKTIVYLATNRSVASQSGLYYRNCVPTSCAINAQSIEDGEKLWEMCLEMIKFSPQLRAGRIYLSFSNQRIDFLQ